MDSVTRARIAGQFGVGGEHPHHQFAAVHAHGGYLPMMPRKGKRHLWVPEEDVVLKDLVQKHGPRRWALVASHMPGRTGKQCRERWHHHVSPTVVKGSWTREEDAIILSMVRTYGRRWSLISRELEGRTDNSIKNRHDSHLKRRYPDKHTPPAPTNKRLSHQTRPPLPPQLRAGAALQVPLHLRPRAPTSVPDLLDRAVSGGIPCGILNIPNQSISSNALPASSSIMSTAISRSILAPPVMSSLLAAETSAPVKLPSIREMVALNKMGVNREPLFSNTAASRIVMLPEDKAAEAAAKHSSSSSSTAAGNKLSHPSGSAFVADSPDLVMQRRVYTPRPNDVDSVDSEDEEEDEDEDMDSQAKQANRNSTLSRSVAVPAAAAQKTKLRLADLDSLVCMPMTLKLPPIVEDASLNKRPLSPAGKKEDVMDLLLQAAKLDTQGHASVSRPTAAPSSVLRPTAAKLNDVTSSFLV